MSEWKELDINIIPSDFFVNDLYELRYVNNRGLIEQHGDVGIIERRYSIIHSINVGHRFQYRIIPTDVIEISREVNDKLVANGKEHISLTEEGVIYMWDNRQVEVTK